MSNPFFVSLLDNAFVNWWLMSERKYTTFQKLFENNCLSYEQVLRLKIAQACYEVVPSVIMTPFVFKFLKLTAVLPKSVSEVRFGRMTAMAVVSYSLAIALRDATYWPIVVQVYAEVNRIDTQRAYQCQ